ncbi:hypothetical protein SARC_07511 [Sphaeroforma arctica JP610]|uniref:ATP-dependent DNA ligase family profile domain-containing protein n=1 Tax=Sphaeroforma arctica JP610 TaxID=667725 RepID=A0A0L0FTZ9_9EUKA|nr:hypothetical protein SARC_07511 [Sphaeroforma arctica JP610]KNC80124.1 hypothetical protein SARC_07511 [Sphaeroforma arctica JP610]|eukprot:XP_014154026.1 hypothetical protein SARC_07511 [Sphaeroforma arctica JP610]
MQRSGGNYTHIAQGHIKLRSYTRFVHSRSGTHATRQGVCLTPLQTNLLHQSERDSHFASASVQKDYARVAFTPKAHQSKHYRSSGGNKFERTRARQRTHAQAAHGKDRPIFIPQTSKNKANLFRFFNPVDVTSMKPARQTIDTSGTKDVTSMKPARQTIDTSGTKDVTSMKPARQTIDTSGTTDSQTPRVSAPTLQPWANRIADTLSRTVGGNGTGATVHTTDKTIARRPERTGGLSYAVQSSHKSRDAVVISLATEPKSKESAPIHANQRTQAKRVNGPTQPKAQVSERERVWSRVREGSLHVRGDGALVIGTSAWAGKSGGNTDPNVTVRRIMEKNGRVWGRGGDAYSILGTVAPKMTLTDKGWIMEEPQPDTTTKRREGKDIYVEKPVQATKNSKKGKKNKKNAAQQQQGGRYGPAQKASIGDGWWKAHMSVQKQAQLLERKHIKQHAGEKECRIRHERLPSTQPASGEVAEGIGGRSSAESTSGTGRGSAEAHMRESQYDGVGHGRWGAKPRNTSPQHTPATAETHATRHAESADAQGRGHSGEWVGGRARDTSQRTVSQDRCEAPSPGVNSHLREVKSKMPREYAEPPTRAAERVEGVQKGPVMHGTAEGGAGAHRYNGTKTEAQRMERESIRQRAGENERLATQERKNAALWGESKGTTGQSRPNTTWTGQSRPQEDRGALTQSGRTETAARYAIKSSQLLTKARQQEQLVKYVRQVKDVLPTHTTAEREGAKTPKVEPFIIPEKAAAPKPTPPTPTLPLSPLAGVWVVPELMSERAAAKALRKSSKSKKHSKSKVAPLSTTEIAEAIARVKLQERETTDVSVLALTQWAGEVQKMNKTSAKKAFLKGTIMPYVSLLHLMYSPHVSFGVTSKSVQHAVNSTPREVLMPPREGCEKRPMWTTVPQTPDGSVPLNHLISVLRLCEQRVLTGKNAVNALAAIVLRLQARESARAGVHTGGLGSSSHAYEAGSVAAAEDLKVETIMEYDHDTHTYKAVGAAAEENLKVEATMEYDQDTHPYVAMEVASSKTRPDTLASVMGTVHESSTVNQAVDALSVIECVAADTDNVVEGPVAGEVYEEKVAGEVYREKEKVTGELFGEGEKYNEKGLETEGSGEKGGVESDVYARQMGVVYDVINRSLRVGIASKTINSVLKHIQSDLENNELRMGKWFSEEDENKDTTTGARNGDVCDAREKEVSRGGDCVGVQAKGREMNIIKMIPSFPVALAEVGDLEHLEKEMARVQRGVNARTKKQKKKTMTQEAAEGDLDSSAGGQSGPAPETQVQGSPVWYASRKFDGVRCLCVCVPESLAHTVPEFMRSESGKANGRETSEQTCKPRVGGPSSPAEFGVHPMDLGGGGGNSGYAETSKDEGEGESIDVLFYTRMGHRIHTLDHLEHRMKELYTMATQETALSGVIVFDGELTCATNSTTNDPPRDRDAQSASESECGGMIDSTLNSQAAPEVSPDTRADSESVAETARDQAPTTTCRTVVDITSAHHPHANHHDEFSLVMQQLRRKDASMPEPVLWVLDVLDAREFVAGTGTRAFSERVGVMRTIAERMKARQATAAQHRIDGPHQPSDVPGVVAAEMKDGATGAQVHNPLHRANSHPPSQDRDSGGERRGVVEQARHAAARAAQVHFIDHMEVRDIKNVRRLVRHANKSGWEGIMLRKGQSVYSGARTNDLVKIKPWLDGEYTVTGVEVGKMRQSVARQRRLETEQAAAKLLTLESATSEGIGQACDLSTEQSSEDNSQSNERTSDGAYADAVDENLDEKVVTRLNISHHGCKVGVGSGLTMAQRRAWAKDPSLITGSVVTVKYREELVSNITQRYSLRHPTLVHVHSAEGRVM